MTENYTALATNLWLELDLGVNLPGVLDRHQAVAIIARWLEAHYGEVGPAMQDYHQKLSEAIEDKVRLHIALMTIRDLPFAEQDNMIAANMRRIATVILHDAR